MKKYGLMLFLIFSVSCFSKNEKSQQLQADTIKKKIAEEKNVSEENTNEIYKDRMKNFIREIRNDAGHINTRERNDTTYCSNLLNNIIGIMNKFTLQDIEKYSKKYGKIK